MGQIAKAQQELQEQPKQRTFKDYIKDCTPAFAAVLPKGFTPERLTQMAIAAHSRTPMLNQCDMKSFLSCCLQCASLGMEPSAVDGLGRAYIIPRKNRRNGTYEAVFQLGKNGMLELIQRSGQVSSIRTQPVYEADDFSFYEDQDGLHFRYKPDMKAERKDENLRLVYLSARLKDGGSVFCYMTKPEIDRIRDEKSISKDRNGNVTGPWSSDYIAMAEKTVIRHAFNRGMLPRSVEIGAAVAQDDSTPVILDEEGYEVFGQDLSSATEVPANVDPVTGEIKEADDAAA